SDLLKSHNLAIDLPQSVLDITVDKKFKLGSVIIKKDGYIINYEESTKNYTIQYSIIINPTDSMKTIVELEDGEIIGYYNREGSYYDPNLCLK
ncbi:hypothetical protein, partial [Methanobrevibacter sp.]